MTQPTFPIKSSRLTSRLPYSLDYDINTDPFNRMLANELVLVGQQRYPLEGEAFRSQGMTSRSGNHCKGRTQRHIYQ